MHLVLRCSYTSGSSAFRLRKILSKLCPDDSGKDEVERAQLLANLKYTADVLETVYVDETK